MDHMKNNDLMKDEMSTLEWLGKDLDSKFSVKCLRGWRHSVNE